MNKKIVFAVAVLMIVGTLFGFVAASASVDQIHAKTRLTRRVFRGAEDYETPWAYIYIMNPTWETVEVESVQCDVYAQGVLHPEWSGRLTPDWYPERWDTKVLPFETSVVLWVGWTNEGEGVTEGIYTLVFTIYASANGESIELKTECNLMVFL